MTAMVLEFIKLLRQVFFLRPTLLIRNPSLSGLNRSMNALNKVVPMVRGNVIDHLEQITVEHNDHLVVEESDGPSASQIAVLKAEAHSLRLELDSQRGKDRGPADEGVKEWAVKDALEQKGVVPDTSEAPLNSGEVSPITLAPNKASSSKGLGARSSNSFSALALDDDMELGNGALVMDEEVPVAPSPIVDTIVPPAKTLGVEGKEIVWLCTHMRTDSYTKRAYKLSLAASIYWIWRERNARVFQGISTSAGRLWSKIVDEVRACICSWRKINPNDENRLLVRSWNVHSSILASSCLA
ncbi:hypothetical protein RHMOL_Rhmol07G0246700 [Rhododendron molle]|uniref:Uncharacterized protein n=1 Tax=Rhododendron molle TaxID=49168 RepID=A0ACC0N447_RHOML|nr:hypothetical protein RHMOL_Rhmol07G0246700 [Rhododendron molle]